jgi:hypothetical protein
MQMEKSGGAAVGRFRRWFDENKTLIASVGWIDLHRRYDSSVRPSLIAASAWRRDQ